MKIVIGCLLTVFIFTGTTPVVAGEEVELQQQLRAIYTYLDRTYDRGGVLTETEIKTIIQDATQWMVRAQEENGHFKYEYQPYTGQYLAGDNMVRQAGALFMMSEVYKHQTDKDPSLATAIEKSIAYFDTVTKEINSDGPAHACVKNSARSSICDLGSTALSLIGILNYVAAEPTKKTVYAETIAQYAQHILSAKFPDKGFSAKYRIGDGYTNNESPFYTGEAMLALVHYYQYQPDEMVQEVLHNTFVYLSGQEYESPLYLWIMAALKDMQRLWPNQAYVNYAADFTGVRLHGAALRHGTSHNYCAPLEGLTSAYSVLETSPNRVLVRQLKDEMDYWLRRSATLQLNRDNPYRVVPTDTGVLLVSIVDTEQAHGGFLTGKMALTQRIDFTQHCVSAYLQKLVDIDEEIL